MPGRAPRAAIVAAIVAASVAMTGYALASLVLPGSERFSDRPGVGEFLVFMTTILAFPVVGSIVVWKRPSNPVGWLFLLVGASMASAVFATEYGNRATLSPHGLPGDAVVVWLGGWTWAVGGAVALPVALALFPDGRLPDHRTGLALRAVVVVALVTILAGAIRPGAPEGDPPALPDPADAGGPAGQVIALLASAGPIVLPLPGIVALLLLAGRARGSRGAERQQLKWLLVPLTVFAAGLAGATVTGADLLWSGALLGLAGVPIAAGIAILRYRLYDVDLVIRRTLVYLVVVAASSAVYAGSTLALQHVLSEAAGGDPVTVALSTLLVASLFGPLRARARALVDRRFYRGRYDAERVVATFTASMRDEVELAAVEHRLAEAVQRAVHPRGASVWIRRP